MRLDQKRVFISDLPETATQSEIENAFKAYGKVKSVEIKERKELGPKNHSLFFAYINIEIDDSNLQKCFKEFAYNEWHGQYVQLQVARESFLERLKREREENGNSTTDIPNNNLQETRKVPANSLNGSKTTFNIKKNKLQASSSESEDTDKEDTKKPLKTLVKTVKTKESSSSSESDTESDVKQNLQKQEKINIVIKNNKDKFFDRNDGLKIASVGNAPILKIDNRKKKKEANKSEANLKRLQSVNEMKLGYRTQQLQIQAALSNVDNKRKNKIIFDDEENPTSKIQKLNSSKTKKPLFDEEDLDEDNFNANFEVREQFQGKQGQKLLELQSKYKNDKRFALDTRFLENEETAAKRYNDNEGDEEFSLEEEKKKEYEILEQVLGKKINPKFQDKRESESMLRFDPSQPEHSKYEMKNTDIPEKKKSKRKEADWEATNEKKKDIETEVPEVSKEIFYKVTENLKDTLHEKQGFSLLSMFGKKPEENNDDVEEEVDISSQKIVANGLSDGKNPFRYDSSDDEDETTNIPSNNNANGTEQELPSKSSKTTTAKFWSESFFFKDDDYRLQDGFDFMERMKSEDKTEFQKIRRDLKEIVRAKVRNNQRKNKPFKKKLGGNRKKKMIRIKKAMKR